MAASRTFDVSGLIDSRRIGAFNVGLIVLSFFIIFVDGYDIAAISFAAPGLVKAWHITDRSALGPVFGASLIGILLGARHRPGRLDHRAGGGRLADRAADRAALSLVGGALPRPLARLLRGRAAPERAPQGPAGGATGEPRLLTQTLQLGLGRRRRGG
jgi:MFS family permease